MFRVTRYPMISKTESGRVGYRNKYRVAGRVRVPAGHWMQPTPAMEAPRTKNKEKIRKQIDKEWWNLPQQGRLLEQRAWAPLGVTRPGVEHWINSIEESNGRFLLHKILLPTFFVWLWIRIGWLPKLAHSLELEHVWSSNIWEKQTKMMPIMF